jgi:hypothetical protein
MLWRIIIAVLAVVIAFALIPPFFAVIGLKLDSNVLLILRVCIAAIAIFYVVRGPTWPNGPA